MSICGAVKGNKRSKKTVNTEDTVAPKASPGGRVDGERATTKIPALSRNVIRFVKS